MGDHGRLYNGFSPDFPILMRELVKEADVICPNITEAALLTDLEYREGLQNEAYIMSLLDGLEKIGAKRIVLTGVCFSEGEVGAAVREYGETRFVFDSRVNGIYHGTGDGGPLARFDRKGKRICGCQGVWRDLPDADRWKTEKRQAA